MLKIFLLTFVTIFILNIANCQNVNTPDTNSKEDSLTTPRSSASEPDDRIFTKVETEAEFPGANPGWNTYLLKNLNVFKPIERGAPAGTYKVVVKFIVSKNGSINNIQAETDHGYGMENEVKRIIKKGPKWIPAKQNGNLVNAYKSQAVTFVIPNE